MCPSWHLCTVTHLPIVIAASQLQVMSILSIAASLLFGRLVSQPLEALESSQEKPPWDGSHMAPRSSPSPVVWWGCGMVCWVCMVGMVWMAWMAGIVWMVSMVCKSVGYGMFDMTVCMVCMVCMVTIMGMECFLCKVGMVCMACMFVCTNLAIVPGHCVKKRMSALPALSQHQKWGWGIWNLGYIWIYKNVFFASTASTSNTGIEDQWVFLGLNCCRNLWFQVIFQSGDPHHNLVTLNLQEDGLVETRNLEEPILNPFLCYTRPVQFKSGWFEMTRLVLTLVNTKIRQFKYVGRYTAWNLGHKIMH